MKIGFIGMGIMGSPMAVNLVKADYDVTVSNRSMEKCARAVAAGTAPLCFVYEGAGSLDFDSFEIF